MPSTPKRGGRGRPPRISPSQILRMLDSGDRQDRREGWKKLYHLLRGGSSRVTKKLIDAVLCRLKEHEDDGVWEDCRRVVGAMFYAMHAAEGKVQRQLERAVQAKYVEAAPSPRLLAPGSLGEGIYLVSAEPSWLARLVDTVRRDEEAVLLLSGLLSRADFPRLEPMPLERGTFQFAIPQHEAIKAVLLVGRPRLYFASEAAFIVWKMEGSRYEFEPGEDQKDPSQRWPDPRYHAILERGARGRVVHRYAASLDDGVLTDYGIIQKYQVVINEHTVDVLVIAGCTLRWPRMPRPTRAAYDVLDKNMSARRFPPPRNGSRGPSASSWKP